MEFKGSSKTAVLDRDWKINPDDTSTFVIVANPGREHVNEGLATGGTINTITLNPLASPNDGTYVGQNLFIRSGTGEDQVAKITGYDGTTKIATMCKDWHTIPDETTGYVMLPSGYIDGEILGNKITEKVWNAIPGDYPEGSIGKKIDDIPDEIVSVF